VKVAEIFASLGFEVDDKGASEFDKKITDIGNNLKKMTFAATAAIYAIDRFVDGATRASVAIGNFAVQTGLSAEKLQRWQYAAQMSNMAMDADTVTTSIRGLQQALTEIKMGGGNPEAFRWLGVNPMNKDAFEVLGQLRKGVANLDPAFASMYLRQIGLNEQWLNVLKLTDTEFTDFMSRAPVRSNAYIKGMEMIGRAARDVRIQFRLFTDGLVERGAPAIKMFYGYLSTLLQIFQSITTAVFTVFERLTKFFNELPKSVKMVAEIIALLRLPLVALLLILDDIATYINGGNSVFGLFMDKLKEGFGGFLDGVGQKIDSLAQKVEHLVRILNEPKAWLNRQKQAVSDWWTVGTSMDNLQRELRGENDPNALFNADAASGKYAGGVAYDNLPKSGEEAYGMGANGEWKPISSEINNADDLFPTAGAALPAGSNFSRTLLNTVNQNNTITVHGATDPQATGAAVSGSLQQQLNHAQSDLNNTVNY
jgi:hypothetical protein